MKFRIFPKKSDVLAMFLERLDTADEMGDDAMAVALSEEIALIESHGPEEIAVELED